MSVFSILNTLLDQRHSCRGFLNKPVERMLVERVVATAQKSAQLVQFSTLAGDCAQCWSNQSLARGAL